jgi:hypothetical protein
MTTSGKLHLRRLSAQERADRAELKAFHGGIKGVEAPKNRLSQLALVLALAATFFGIWLAVVGLLIGFILLAVGLPATVGITVWCLRRWDY